MTMFQAKTIFSEDFLKQLTSISINGNFGDMVMNPETPDIVEYFKKANPNLWITISTNGSARAKDFWIKLANSKVRIDFCLDGLEDTHHLYRQNTAWNTIIKNAKTFIAAGGHAVWKFIAFDHNRHQVDSCRELSKKLGFLHFEIVSDGRDVAPVFNKDGELTHTLGNYTGEKSFEILFHKKKTDEVMLEDITVARTPKNKISCKIQTSKSIYIAANGDVSPCCWTGLYPKTYGAGQYHQAANAQLIPLIAKNNALEHPLEQCVEWFKSIENSWKISTYEQGRLVICDDVCGNAS